MRRKITSVWKMLNFSWSCCVVNWNRGTGTDLSNGPNLEILLEAIGPDEARP